MKIFLAIASVALLLAHGCGAPAGRGGARDEEEASSSGDEDDIAEEESESIDGTWAPRASLARVEDIPRRGRVEERPSRTGAVRVIALLPVDGTGNHVVELVGLPALDRDVVVASLRASHAQPQWVGCDELAFVGDGQAQPVDDAQHEGGMTALGVQEAIQGRIPLSRLDSVASARDLVVKSCENEYAVDAGPVIFGEFVRRFRALTAGPSDVGEAPEEEAEEEAEEAPAEAAEDVDEGAATEGPR